MVTRNIDEACEAFRAVLTEQLRRNDEMNGELASQAGACRYSEGVVIGIVPGDGIGPMIMTEAVRALKILLSDEIASGRVVIKDIEGLTIENRIKCGKSVPDDVLSDIKSCDILLKGPTTTPKGGSMESANVALRRELDLYANIRPIKIPDEGINWIFFRENTEGEYVLGSRGVEICGENGFELAMDFKVTTDAGTRRIAKAAFDYAVNNGKKRVAIVTKANIMKKTDGNFSRICHEVAGDYPGIKAEDWYIDIMTANLVDKAVRSDFQVFVLPNLYGDIITDEAAAIQGGVGTAGSANVGSKYAFFEAIHGSAPRMIDDGLENYANPASIMRAEVMLLRHIGRLDAANALETALDKSETDLKAPKVTGLKDGSTCREFSDYIIDIIKHL